MQLALIFSPSPSLPLAWGMPVGYEWIIIGAIGLLIFGKRLPGAAKGIGQSILEFKKGMKTGGDDAEAPAQIEETKAAPKARFDPQTGKPLE